MNTEVFLTNNSEPDTRWSSLYLVTALLSVLMLLIIPIQIIVFVVSPPPQTVKEFFYLYHENWFLGLLSLDLLYLFNNVILIFIYLALFVRMFREKPSTCLIALALGFVGISCYFSSNPTFEMLTLSTKYFSSQSEGQSNYLAAGEALMAGFTGTSFDVYYVLNAIVLLLFSKAILKSSYFNKTIGKWGMLSGILMIIPSSAGTIGIVFSLLSLIPWIVFLLLLVKRFYTFSRNIPE